MKGIEKMKAEIEEYENQIQEIKQSKTSYLTSIGHIRGRSYNLNTAKKMARFEKEIKILQKTRDKKKKELVTIIKRNQKNHNIGKFKNIIKRYYGMRRTYLKKKEFKSNKIKNKFIYLVKSYVKIWYGVEIEDEDEHKIRKMCRNALNVRQQNRCAVCGRSLNGDITYEHIIPVSNNGMTSMLNGKAVHSWCNNYLGVLPIERKTNMFVELDESENETDCYKKYEDSYDDTYDDDNNFNIYS